MQFSAVLPIENPEVQRRHFPGAWRRLCSDCAGITAVEFALMAPVFLTLFFGVIELGRAAYTQGVVTFAAEEATRYAVVNYSISEEEVRDLTEDCLLGVKRSRINAIVVTGPVNPADNTRTISVEVSYNFEFLMPFLPDDTVTISGNSRGFLIPPPLGAAPVVTGSPIGCGR
ncbi:TadE family protein [Pelagibius sp. CAU 1746]|uniref:TadE/TadG family type IV pilus assembly protein n=1 Tax=Pelagibius sp. CAU 1746 TaxID=3140370 RepID=UPI00325BF91B